MAGYSLFTSSAAAVAFSKLRPPRRMVYVFEGERRRDFTVSKPRPVFAPVMRTIVFVFEGEDIVDDVKVTVILRCQLIVRVSC